MIRGIVRNLEGIVELEVLGGKQRTRRIEAVIDTGYNGYLTLPAKLIAGLQLPFAGHRRGRLADGTIILLNVYQADATWHGQPRKVLVSEAAESPLVGMSMIQGCRLTMDVIDQGDLVISEIP